jgi:hypothetical protein
MRCFECRFLLKHGTPLDQDKIGNIQKSMEAQIENIKLFFLVQIHQEEVEGG